MKIYTYGIGHMTKMAAMPIYNKNPSKIFFSRASGLIAMKIDMYNKGLERTIVYSYYDPRMT